LEDTVESSTEEQIVKKWNSWVANVKGASPSSDESTSDDLQGGERLDDEDDDDSENSEELAEQLEEAGVSGVSTEKTTTTDVSKRPKKDSKKKKAHKPFELFSSSDVVGVVFLEVSSVTDLPPEKNSMLRQLDFGSC
jgi:phosphatidylserine decarboxylase